MPTSMVATILLTHPHRGAQLRVLCPLRLRSAPHCRPIPHCAAEEGDRQGLQVADQWVSSAGRWCFVCFVCGQEWRAVGRGHCRRGSLTELEYPVSTLTKREGRGHMPAGITLTELVEKMLWLRQLIKERGGRVSPFRVEAAHEVEQPFRPTSCVA